MGLTRGLAAVGGPPALGEGGQRIRAKCMRGERGARVGLGASRNIKANPLEDKESYPMGGEESAMN